MYWRESLEKLQLPSLLKHIGFSRDVKAKIVVGALLMKTRVLNSNSEPTKILDQGEAYGFGVELVRNIGLWPLNVDILSRVSDMAIISFGDGQDIWHERAEVLPYRGRSEMVELLNCHSSNANSAFIRTTVSLVSGDNDTTTLELQIRK